MNTLTKTITGLQQHEEAQRNPVALLVENICQINNGGMQEVERFLASQPSSVRMRFIERCSSLIGSAAESIS